MGVKLTLVQGHQLRMLENIVLSRIFEPKRNEVTGDERQFHNQELH